MKCILYRVWWKIKSKFWSNIYKSWSCFWCCLLVFVFF